MGDGDVVSSYKLNSKAERHTLVTCSSSNEEGHAMPIYTAHEKGRMLFFFVIMAIK
eukprot:CAMPEP_0171500532 /NCGR_PEP_ID=MMETSP0958-20121227/9039_1 /TAXON_ID=87120 /ORGANISM="Aurantiochytrium limacinum, Strain ATCCMYA-1381" /LENGTH=55 /DNA_ID=CAMNT_0012035215 /DNA_START=573 /DNA_END=740 /DNA_ORIENTATION=+